MHPRAQLLIDQLGLQPHPEGGFYREIHRSTQRVHPQDGRALRSALTTIYFLLAAPAFSRWHRVASDEVWHLYEGGPLELRIADPQLDAIEVVRLDRVDATTRPVATVLAGYWQAARPLADYALIGATVGPGFEFEDFAFLAQSSALAARLHNPIDRSLL
jgi:predicted cupin superfamily sugar epimerase